ncbi:MAG: RidA family protein [Rhodococcus sp. (in: high G+C Gram-positive bacteria)]|jgi:2-iminobutanoate/2-iminopropanoate deaminase
MTMPSAAGPPLSTSRWIGDQLHTSGIVAMTPGRDLSSDVNVQIQTIFDQLAGLLSSNDLSTSSVGSVSVYLASMEYFDALNTAYREFFRPPYPVRTTISCGLFPGVLVEMSIIATGRNEQRGEILP